MAYLKSQSIPIQEVKLQASQPKTANNPCCHTPRCRLGCQTSLEAPASSSQHTLDCTSVGLYHKKTCTEQTMSSLPTTLFYHGQRQPPSSMVWCVCTGCGQAVWTGCPCLGPGTHRGTLEVRSRGRHPSCVGADPSSMRVRASQQRTRTVGGAIALAAQTGGCAHCYAQDVFLLLNTSDRSESQGSRWGRQPRSAAEQPQGCA